MNKELWRPVVGYEGLYEVSNFGRVRSLGNRTHKGVHILKQANKGKYLFVELCKDGVRKQFLVHRLVAQAFIPNPENKPTVDHINMFKTDNKVENLRWATQTEQHTFIDQDIREREIMKNRNSPKQKCRAVCQYTIDGAFICEYPSLSEAERQINVGNANISKVCLGKSKTAGGYIWKFKI